MLPVVINGVDDENPVISGEWTLTLTNNIAAIDRVETTGTLLDGKSVLFNPTTRRLAFALSDSITTNGILLYLEVQVREDAGKFQRANIGLQDILLNEDLVEVNTEPGSVTVQGVAVNPSGIVQPVVVGNTVQFTATGNTVLPVTWRTSNENFATINQDGLLQAVSPGNVRVYITDAIGQQDSTALFRVAPENLNDLTLSFGSISVFQTLIDTLYIEVSDVTGLNITSAEFEFNFPSDRLELLDLVDEGSILDGMPAIRQSGNTIRVAFAGSTPLSGSGRLLGIRFRVRPDARGTATFAFTKAMFNENLSAEVVGGSVSILNAPAIEVRPDVVTATIGDTLNFSVESGGRAPYRFVSSDSTVASIDAQTGELRALSRGAIVITAFDADDFPSPGTSVRVNDIRVSIETVEGEVGDTLDVPVHAMDVTGLGIFSAQLTIDYDTTVVSFLGANLTGGIAGTGSLVTSDVEGRVRIAIASTEALQGEGLLAGLEFLAVGESVPVERGDITLVEAVFNEAGPFTPTATLVSGQVLVSEAEPEPLPVPLLISPVNNAVVSPDSVVLAWEAVELSGVDYRLQVSTDSLFAQVVLDTLQSETTRFLTGLASDSLYYWSVRVEFEEQLGDSSVAVFRTDVRVEEPEDPEDPEEPEPLPVPVLTSPMNNANSVPLSPTLSWEAVERADLYRIQLRAVNELQADSLIADSLVSVTEFAVMNLRGLTTHNWRVQALADTLTSAWSAWFVFETITEVSLPNNNQPVAFDLGQNYPNPFNPTTTIQFTLAESGEITLEVINVLGHTVATLVNEFRAPGNYQITFNGSGLSSGVYFYRLKSGTNIQTRRMLLVK